MTVPNALTAWPEIAARLKAADRVLLALDFDGTLAPIVERPEQAAPPPRTARLLRDLAQLPWLTLAIVSGRALADVRGRVGVPGLFYAGNHGMEIEGPGARFVDPQAVAARGLLEDAVRVIERDLAAVDGVIVEDKGLSASVHYRLVRDDLRPAVVQGVHAAVRREGWDAGRLVLREGKMVLELRPALSWHKGRAVGYLQDLVRDVTGHEPLPVYIGDDMTDEDAFEAVNGREGLSIVVAPGGRTTVAHYQLVAVERVADFLEEALHLDRDRGAG